MVIDSRTRSGEEETMAEQARKQKKTQERRPSEGGAASAKVTDEGKRLKEEMDRLAGEIDEILEENAEEFVRSYVQSGGE